MVLSSRSGLIGGHVFKITVYLEGHVFKVEVNFRSCFKDQGLLGGQARGVS